MFAFKIKETELKIDVLHSEDVGSLFFNGPDFEEREILTFLNNSLGPYALPVLDEDGQARPADIAFALGQSKFNWSLVQGKISEYQIPPSGSVT